MKSKLVINFVVMVFVFLAFVSTALAQDVTGPLVPNFTLETNTGEFVSFADLEGKIVIMNFWASRCPPCIEEMGEFQALYDHLADSNEIVLMMVNQTDGVRETRATADKFLADHGYDMSFFYDSGEVGLFLFGIPGIPTTVVIDKNGYLDNFIVGPTDFDTVMEMVEEAR